MRRWGTGSKACLLGSALLLSVPLTASAAETGHRAAAIKPVSHIHPLTNQVSAQAIVHRTAFLHGVSPSAHGRHAVGRSMGISCVPYARQVSGITVPGNAWQWWGNAAGMYARGDRPEPGSVLNFRANGRMRLGHVAVVTRVINAREIIVDQANWPSNGMRGNVSHDIAIVDVSEANNWSAVRVALGHDTKFGSVYPTYGFIYNRPDTGMVMASVNRPAPQPQINPVPSDLRPVAERPWQMFEEVAESPVRPVRRIDMRVQSSRAGY